MKKKRFSAVGSGFIAPVPKADREYPQKWIDRFFSYIYDGGA